jgi:hypothetical protein
MADLAPTLAPILALALAASTTGCETFLSHSCDNSVAGNLPATTYAGGTVADGVYMSSAWDGELLWFPGGKAYVAVPQHPPLPAMPRWITLYVSFSMHGIADGGTVARASPNEAEILSVGPLTIDGDGGSTVPAIEVQNPGCQDFWLLIAAGTGAVQP